LLTVPVQVSWVPLKYPIDGDFDCFSSLNCKTVLVTLLFLYSVQNTVKRNVF